MRTYLDCIPCFVRQALEAVRMVSADAAVHPMRREAIEKMLAKAGVSWSLVEALQARGDLAASAYEGNEYYLRSFRKTAKD